MMAYRDDVLANDPIVYFEFEETVGSTAADSSPNNNDGAYGAGIVKGETGAHGNGIRSSNLTNNNWVNVPTLDAPTSLETFQIEAQIKATGYGGGDMRVWENAPPTVSPGDEQIITVGSNNVVFQVKIGGSMVSTTWDHDDAPIDGSFHLLQCVYDGECTGIFWDGVLKSQQAASGAFNPTLNGPQLVVGNADDISAGDDAFVGYIDDFAFYPANVLFVCAEPEEPPAVGGDRNELYYDQLGLTELATQVVSCPSFTFVDAAFTMVDGGLTATLPTYDVGDVLVLGYHHNTGSLADWELAGFAHSSANEFEIMLRIADGTEGTDVTLPSGDGFPAVIVAYRPMALTYDSLVAPGSPPWFGLRAFYAYQTSSVASGDTPGTFPVTAFSQLVSADGEIDTFSIAFILTDGTWPGYTWNNEFERVRFLDVDSGWAATVADGQHDSTTTASPLAAPSLTWDVATSSIYHGAAQFICSLVPEGSGDPACNVDTFGDLINDDFADALVLSVFGDSSFAFGGGYAGSHSPEDGETTVGATKEVGEPNHNGNAGGHSIWFSYTPLDSGVALIQVDGNGTDSIGKSMLLAMYTGASVGALSEVAYDVTAPDPGEFNTTNACGDQTPITYLEATVVGGTTYYIAVDVADGETVNAILLSGSLS